MRWRNRLWSRAMFAGALVWCKRMTSTPSSVHIIPFGAQLLQASLAGRELFYLSPGPHQPGTARRGGVPVLFPQFALNGPLPKHGFVRNRDWVVDKQEGVITAWLSLVTTDFPTWPYAAFLRLTTETASDCLVQTLRIENTGVTPFAFSGGLHPYWRVDELSDCTLQGLSLHGLGGREIDEWHAIATPVQLQEAGRVLQLTQQGFEGWQVWSPGPAHALTDLPHADWRRFLCIEPVVMTPRWLAPGETFVGVLQAQWV